MLIFGANKVNKPRLKDIKMAEYKIKFKNLIKMLKTGENARIEFYNNGKYAILPANAKHNVSRQPLATIVADVDFYNLYDYDQTGCEYVIGITEKWLKIKGLDTIMLCGDIMTLQVSKDFFE